MLFKLQNEQLGKYIFEFFFKFHFDELCLQVCKWEVLALLNRHNMYKIQYNPSTIKSTLILSFAGRNGEQH